MIDIDEDIFSCILAQIPYSKTLYTILVAIPKSHLLFSVALVRLWQLPVYLDSYDARASAASQKVLDYLLDTPGPHPLAKSIRHLVILIEHPDLGSYYHWGNETPPRDRTATDFQIPADVVALQERLPDLFRRTVNLEWLEYHSFPGIDLKARHLEPLQHLERLRRFSVDCALRNRGGDTPAAGEAYAAPGEMSAQYDAENWEMEPFLSTIGPSIVSLNLRHVNRTMFATLTSKTDVFASYHTLESLKMDITEGVWDWDGGGSPVAGASEDFIFPCLEFPAVKRFELVVSDRTLYNPRTGPLDLVHRNLLTELSLEMVSWVGWTTCKTIKVFEALSPLELSALSHLEITDSDRNTQRHYWGEDEDDDEGDDEGEGEGESESERKVEGRTYFGLVPSFLRSICAGRLPNLTSLWVDERILISPHVCTIQDLLDPESREEANILSRNTLSAVFRQLKSLRVGFGAITHVDAGLILDLCDPNKLTQFGFEWNWREYGREEALSPGLLAHLARFPKLTDVHILFPRPKERRSGIPDPILDERTLSDVASIFKCNGIICRVGIGNSVVWERHPSEWPSKILLTMVLVL
ncbi:hypothetical protein DFH09DRAFT_1374688 [Mycena vulgaris]|nr:hypothetical protein DFH09DRAFT_1374688 [Mycena vulgaris]